MCGIAYLKHFSKKANNGIIELYNNQSHRGNEGFGCMFLDGKIKVGRSENENGIVDIIKKHNSSEILFHHRYPTSTPNFTEATHPIHVSHKELEYDYYVVHNGVITNTKQLKELHDKLGYVYTTLIEQKYFTKVNTYSEIMYNDSECLAIEIARFVEGLSDKIGTSGSVAFIAIQINKKTKQKEKMFYGRNGGNPLKSFRSRNRFILSSEFDGGVLLPENKLFCFDYKTEKTTEQDVQIGSYISPSYNHGTVKTQGVGGLYESDYHGVSAGIYDNYDYNDFDDLPKSYKDIKGVTFDEERYFELVEEESDLIGWLKTAKLSGDVDEQMELEAELFLVREELKMFDSITL